MRQLSLLACFILFSSVGFAQAGPPSGYAWTENINNGHWYALTPAAAGWSQSRDEASLFLGVELASIQDQAENDWILSLVQQAPPSEHSVWIGLTDEVVECQWEWSSGDPFYDVLGNPIFANWGDDEPSGCTGSPTEDFVAMTISHPSSKLDPGEWNDDFDSTGYRAVLEWTPNPPELGIANLVSGKISTVSLSGFSPDSAGFVLYSFSGDGPINTRWGSLSLSHPISFLSSIHTDSLGGAVRNVKVPVGLVGKDIWLQAFDFKAKVFSNALAEQIG